MAECSEGGSGTTTVTEEVTESPTVCKIFDWNFQLTGNPELNTARSPVGKFWKKAGMIHSCSVCVLDMMLLYNDSTPSDLMILRSSIIIYFAL